MAQRWHLSNDVRFVLLQCSKQAGMRQDQVARCLGVSQSVISCLPNTTTMKCYSQLFCIAFNITTSCCRMTTRDPIENCTEQCESSRLVCSIPWLVANRACFFTFRPACTTESSSTKNTSSFGRRFQEEWRIPQLQIASSLFGLHRCNRWTYTILTDIFVRFYWWPQWSSIHIFPTHLVMQSQMGGILSVNKMM